MQYVIHQGATPEQARDAALMDDRNQWHAKGLRLSMPPISLTTVSE
ncbi:hypothetical protein JHW44_20245 (plasmid) [Paracoccus seriniphilus]|nr:hypothetical protein JHW44_20245 [Paracoccus seriniphilus]